MLCQTCDQQFNDDSVKIWNGKRVCPSCFHILHRGQSDNINPPHAQTAVPPAQVPRGEVVSPQIIRTPQQPEVVSDWQTPAAYVAFSIGILAFIASWMGNPHQASLFDGFFNPIFYIGVILGWYWFNEGKQIGGKKPNPDPSPIFTERQQEFIRQQVHEQHEGEGQETKHRERERQEAVRIQEALRMQKKEREEQAERRQRNVEEALRTQKERERQEAVRIQEAHRKQRERELSEGGSLPKQESKRGWLAAFVLFVPIAVLTLISWMDSSNSDAIPAKTDSPKAPIRKTHTVPERLVGRWKTKIEYTDKGLVEAAKVMQRFAGLDYEESLKHMKEEGKKPVSLSSNLVTIDENGSTQRELLFKSQVIDLGQAQKWVCTNEEGNFLQMKSITGDDDG